MLYFGQQYSFIRLPLDVLTDSYPDPLAGIFIQDIPTNVKIRLIFG